jgi:ribosome maturation protein SDO1
MVSLDEAVVIRLKTHGHNFEILVDPDLALEFKSGEKVDLSSVLAAEHVFKDAGAGDKASEEVMKNVFGTSDERVVAVEVIKKGELHLTTEQKRRMLEDRKKQIAAIITRTAINPQTKTPHPQSRILQAMEEAKYEVKITKSAREQVERVVKALRPLIPIRVEKVQVAVRIPAHYTRKMYDVLHKYGEVKKEEWVGSVQYCLLEIPGGMQDELSSTLNNLTHGEVEIKVI